MLRDVQWQTISTVSTVLNIWSAYRGINFAVLFFFSAYADFRQKCTQQLLHVKTTQTTWNKSTFSLVHYHKAAQ